MRGPIPASCPTATATPARQIIGETIKYKLDLNILRVPYSSNPTALTDLLSNSIQLMPIDYLNGVPLVESKRIVALAVGTKVRYSELPNTPTLA